MALRKRKKEPPDPMPLPLESPFTRSYLVDLASFLITSRFRFQLVSFPCSIFDFGFSAVSNSSQVCFPPQPVAGVQRQISWFRFHLPSSTIQAGVCVQKLWICDGLTGYTRGRSSASKVGSAIQFRGPRSTIVERRCQDWQIYSVSLRRIVRCSFGSLRYSNKPLFT